MDHKTSKYQREVTQFFDGYAEDFHQIYGRRDASTLGGIVDRLTRQGMFARFEEVFNRCESQGVKSLLDVGCGPGTHDVFLAEKLGIKIEGIDVAPKMIEIAKGNSSARGVDGLCDYIVADFMHFDGGCDYDVSLALGVVEYIENPVPFIRKMMSHSKMGVMFSLPVKWHFLTPQRMIRYKLRNCPLVFYDRVAIDLLMNQCGATAYEIKKLHRDYLVIINK